MTINTNNTLLNNSRKLLLKNQLYLNLNVTQKSVNVGSNDKADDSDGRTVAAAAPAAAAAAVPADGDYVETVTTVPQQQLNKQHSRTEATTTTTKEATSLSSTLLNSSSTALAKFNRIIDSTVPATNCYQTLDERQAAHQQQHVAPPALSSALQQRLALAYPNIAADNSQVKKQTNQKKINSTTATATPPKAVASAVAVSSTRVSAEANEEKDDDDDDDDDDNQMKRNDVHYLLKQLNSFSDIEEIEIVGMKQRAQPLPLVPAPAPAEKSHSPTATSLVIISPSTQSHKGIRRYASLHQQQQPDELDDALEPYAHNSEQRQRQHMLQQFDDYIFQSCHYLETNYFAATYRTAMVESSSHEFRPSTTTGTATDASTTGSHSAAVSSAHSLELHEVEPPSVICKAAAPSSTSPPAARYHMQTRLTSSGVQTELTASSLSTAATAASLAKSSSSTSSSEQRRRAPFFKCCYTPIDRWREKRSVTQKRPSSAGASAGTSATTRQPASAVATATAAAAYKNGHAV